MGGRAQSLSAALQREFSWSCLLRCQLHYSKVTTTGDSETPLNVSLALAVLEIIDSNATLADNTESFIPFYDVNVTSVAVRVELCFNRNHSSLYLAPLITLGFPPSTSRSLTTGC
jgi:hypothetical protein